MEARTSAVIARRERGQPEGWGVGRVIREIAKGTLRAPEKSASELAVEAELPSEWVADLDAAGIADDTLGAMKRFLLPYRESANMRVACQAAHIGRRTVLNWRDRWAIFAEIWDECKDDAADLLEKEAWRRALADSSDKMLMWLLENLRPEKFKQQVQFTATVKVEHWLEQLQRVGAASVTPTARIGDGTVADAGTETPHV